MSAPGRFVVDRPHLAMTPTSLTDSIGTIDVDALPDPPSRLGIDLAGDATPLTRRLWRIALDDIEHDTVAAVIGKHFSAGANFGSRLFLRDCAYAGVLGLDRLFPEPAWNSIVISRRVRREIGFHVPKGCAVAEIDIEWQESARSWREFGAGLKMGGYHGCTDDVIWLWCAHDLLTTGNRKNVDWEWVFTEGEYFFAQFYQPWFDRGDGLFRGQASFVDIHFSDHKTTGYPMDWEVADCVLLKALSTNCLYYRAMVAMADIARHLESDDRADYWERRASMLREAIRSRFTRDDGALEYYVDRAGIPSGRRDALGTALAVVLGVVDGDAARAALAGYPVTDKGVPLFHPFYDHSFFYHNNTSWPFVDTFFLQALEIAEETDYTDLNAALLGRTCGPVYETDWSRLPPDTIAETPSDSEGTGTFHEVVHFPTGRVTCSARQLWTAASFINVCLRAGLVAGV